METTTLNCNLPFILISLIYKQLSVQCFYKLTLQSVLVRVAAL